jgi:hypothetical protein
MVFLQGQNLNKSVSQLLKSYIDNMERKEKLEKLENSVESKPREGGNLKGKIWIAPDFDELPENILNSFYKTGCRFD